MSLDQITIHEDAKKYNYNLKTMPVIVVFLKDQKERHAVQIQ